MICQKAFRFKVAKIVLKNLSLGFLIKNLYGANIQGKSVIVFSVDNAEGSNHSFSSLLAFPVYAGYGLKSQESIGNSSTIVVIIIPGTERYGLYAGSPLFLLFVISDKNQLPRIMATENMAIILMRVIKFSKKLLPI